MSSQFRTNKVTVLNHTVTDLCMVYDYPKTKVNVVVVHRYTEARI